MSHEYIFGESTRKARGEHFCDFCCNWIQPGETYRRWLWVPRRGIIHVMKEHDTPQCPPNIGEQMALEMMQAERAALGVPIVLAIEQRAVIKLSVEGKLVTEFEPVFVPRAACEAVPPQEYVDDGEEIPF